MTDPSQRFGVLRASYARSFAAKHAALDEAWRAFDAAANDASARALQVLVHRLAGSAPAYDFADLGKLAAAADRALIGWCETPSAARAAATLGEIAALMQALLEALARHAADGSAAQD